jgi:uncharacterized Zn finger protein (UPF0148 family)
MDTCARCGTVLIQGTCPVCSREEFWQMMEVPFQKLEKKAFQGSVQRLEKLLLELDEFEKFLEAYMENHFTVKNISSSAEDKDI